MASNTSRQTVLVADDDKFLASLVKQALEDTGLSVHLAHDGVTAIRLIDNLQPDLVVLDLAMPGKSGLDVLREIKGNSRHRYIPVVMLTAARSEGAVMESIKLGASDYVTKPFPPALLVRRVLNHLGSIELD